jgi:predicted patatin/cPLA2 family phospholipase
MKNGVVDVGGGLRGIYAAGVFDYCLDTGIRFDYCIGVSAGSANVTSYLAGQNGRNYRFYYDYSFRKKYMSPRNLILKGSYIDLDYIYGTLSNADGEDPLDFDAFRNNPAEFRVVATEAKTGNVKYFNRSDINQDDYGILKASSALPVVCRPYAVGKTLYFDGALGDAVPVKKAFEDGCDRVVVILTRPENTPRSPEKDVKLAKSLRRKYPVAAEKLCLRAKQYNENVIYAQNLAKQKKVLIVAPDDITGVDTLSKNREALQRLYKKGYHDAEKIRAFLNISDNRIESGIQK